MADFMNPSADLQAGREAGWNDRQREIDDLLDQVTVLEERLAAEETAKIPRPPKAEWFGTGPNQWDSWCIVWTDGSSDLCRCARWDADSIVGIDWEGRSTRWTIPPDMVVPVARTGYPAPVGWKVVGG